MDPTQIASSVAVNVITEIFKRVVSTAKSTDIWATLFINRKDLFNGAARKYAEQFERRYNSIKILGMNEPVALRDIYVRVSVLDKVSERMSASLEDLERFFDRDRRHFGRIRKTEDGLTAVNKIERMIVLGKPGSGKSTFLKFVGLKALDGTLGFRKVPIFISLKDWSDSGDTLFAHIVNQFAICGFPEREAFVEQALLTGNALVLLDGLDEVTRDVNSVIREIRDFAEKFNKSNYILSCRLAAYNYVFEKFSDVELSDFNDEQIHNFIENWFGPGSPKAHSCWEEFVRDTSIRELGSVPLLLTMLCLAYDETMRFPTNRAELYKEAIDALLKKWDSSRSIRREDPYQFMSLRHKENMLSRIAVRTFEKKQYFIPKRVLIEHIEEYLTHIVKSNREEDANGEIVLQSIIAQHGLLAERARGIYSFSHLTFQEYFCARYIVEFQSRGTLSSLIYQHFLDPKWREVILLTAGMLSEADELVHLMLSAWTHYGENGTVARFLMGCAEIIRFVNTSARPQRHHDYSDLIRVSAILKDFSLTIHDRANMAGIWREIERVFVYFTGKGDVTVEALDAGEEDLIRTHYRGYVMLKQCLSPEFYLCDRGNIHDLVKAGLWDELMSMEFLSRARDWADTMRREYAVD